MNSDNKDIAKSIAAKIYKSSHNKSDIFTLQLFIENLVLPENCRVYDEDELSEHIINFMEKNQTANLMKEALELLQDLIRLYDDKDAYMWDIADWGLGNGDKPDPKDYKIIIEN